jgi:tripartite-type tricarboxylate transporter receptor subunit TctC
MSKDAQAWWATTLKTMTGTKTWKESLEKLQWVDAYADAADFAKFLQDEYDSHQGLMATLGFAK